MIENHMVIGNWCDGSWDCTCDDSKPEEKCGNCIVNDPDYFEEPDDYRDDE